MNVYGYMLGVMDFLIDQTPMQCPPERLIQTMLETQDALMSVQHEEHLSYEDLFEKPRPAIHWWIVELAILVGKYYRCQTVIYSEVGQIALEDFGLRYIGVEPCLVAAQTMFQLVYSRMTDWSEMYTRMLYKRGVKQVGLRDDFYRGFLIRLYEDFEDNVIEYGYRDRLVKPEMVREYAATLPVVSFQAKKPNIPDDTRFLQHNLSGEYIYKLRKDDL